MSRIYQANLLASCCTQLENFQQLLDTQLTENLFLNCMLLSPRQYRKRLLELIFLQAQIN